MRGPHVLARFMALLLGFVSVTGSVNAQDQKKLFERESEAIQDDLDKAGEPVEIKGYPPSQRKVSEEPAWLGSDAGTSDVVLPPWTPVSLDNRVVSIWNRKYQFARSGMPKRIISGDQQLLAGPIKVRARMNRRWVSLKPKNFNIRTAGDTKAVVKSTGRVGGLTYTLKATVAYDGFVWFDFSVKPNDNEAVRVQQLALDIPVPREHAQFFNHADLGTSRLDKDNTSLLFANSADGGRVPAEGLAIPFTAQFSLRDYERGLSWVCQSDQDWRLENPQKALTVAVEGDRTILRAHWIDNPTTIERPLHLAWGLTALPVRPQTGWKQYQVFHASQSASAAHALNRMDEPFDLMAGHPSWAQPESLQADANDNKHRSENRNRLDLAKEHGLDLLIIHQMWTELQGYPGTFREKNRKRMRRIVRQAHRRGLKVIAYLGSEISTAAPLWETFGAKMVRIRLDGGKSRDDPEARAFRPGANRYYNDFLVHKTREMIRQYNIDGVFLDGHPSIVMCMNPRHGHGYKVDGGRRGTANVLAVRRLLRRLYTLFKYEAKKDGLIIGHSGGPYNPALAYVDLKLAGEGQTFRRLKNPQLDLMDLFSPASFAAMYNPQVTGVPLLAMSKPGRGGFKVRQTSTVSLLFGVMPRARWPELFSEKEPTDPDDIEQMQQNSLYAPKLWRVFNAYDPSGAKWHPYWNNEDLVALSAKNTEVSFYAREGRDVLAVVSNPTGDSVSVDIEWNLKALGLDADRFIARDAMSGKRLDVTGRLLSLDLDSESFRLVLLKDERGQTDPYSELWYAD